MGVHPVFRPGELVRIADRAALDEFYLSYKLHHRLEERQLSYAGKTAKVIQASMYHGGDQLYELEVSRASGTNGCSKWQCNQDTIAAREIFVPG